MFSRLLHIKNRIKNFITTKKHNRERNRHRNYAIVIEDNIMNVDVDDFQDEVETIVAPPPPSPVTTRKLFNSEVDISLIQEDYELQELLKMMDIHQIDISGVRLEDRFETILCNHTTINNEITLIKMKLLYVIIANNMYRTMFEEKKKYRSLNSDQYIGVFRYNDYIIRIDDCPYSFINETTVNHEMDSKSAEHKDEHDHAVVRPFLIYINARHRKETNTLCDCRKSQCECEYIDNAEIEFKSDDIDRQLAKCCFNKLRKKTISFSIQYYVKDTVTLYIWVKENISCDVYSRFASIQRIFFLHLFYRCARLLRIVHRAGIVHGDIKPDNILFKEEPNFDINHPERCKNFTVYLIDFGLSGKHQIGVGTGGTIPYCHPEFKNIVDTNTTSKYKWKILDVKHDVWSLGISFLTMYIYHDFYCYYNKYPNYFFLKDGYIASIIIDVITDTKINELFSKMMTVECIPSKDVCTLLEMMIS
jgi:serine/threonine protein kinase